MNLLRTGVIQTLEGRITYSICKQEDRYEFDVALTKGNRVITLNFETPESANSWIKQQAHSLNRDEDR